MTQNANEASDTSSEVKRLQQLDILEKFLGIDRPGWFRIYSTYPLGEEGVARYCALLAPERVSKSLENPAWDLTIGQGNPGIIVSHDRDGERLIRYHRFGDHEAEPFIFCRSFFGVFPSHEEVSEEFRLYFNLFESRDEKKFEFVRDDGYCDSVIERRDQNIDVAAKFMLEYLTARRMCLALYVESLCQSDILLREEDIERIASSHASSSYHVEIHAGNYQMITSDGKRSFSRPLGKKIVLPNDVDSLPLWPGKKENEVYPEFIIGIDQAGEDVLASCDPDALANNFGANRGSPHYLTPVYFRKEVLRKYYAQSERYEVEDSYLRCKGLWGLQLDNNQKDFVVAWLGDLGRDLPEGERTYWRSFNVFSDMGISSVYLKRAIHGQFADATSEDLVFKREYERFGEIWRKKNGWDLFLPLNSDDRHHFAALRIPLTMEQQEYDEQILSLAKLLSDSLNVGELRKRIAVKDEKMPSIKLLEKYLQERSPDFNLHKLDVLRTIQALRSASAAHRKGSKYLEALKKSGLVGVRGPEAVRTLLTRAVDLLKPLGEMAASGGT